MQGIELQRATNGFSSLGPSVSKDVAELRTRMRRLFDEPFGKFFDEPFRPELLSSTMGWYPPIEVTETSEEFTVIAELPGMKRKDVHLDFDNGTLTLRGEKEDKREEKDSTRRFYVCERNYGAFQRSFSFPFADMDKATAEFSDGLLTIHVPKLPHAKMHGHKIEIADKK
jgi:HSP20 family protein